MKCIHLFIFYNREKAKLRVSLAHAITLITIYNTACINRKDLPIAFRLAHYTRCTEDLEVLCYLSHADMTFLESEKTV